MKRSIFFKILLLSLILFFSLRITYASTVDRCTQMYLNQWQGTYSWTYRGDHFQLPVTADVKYLSAHHYSVTMYLHSDIPSTIELKGTCMDSQIYLEEDPSITTLPAYLQGSILDDGIHLTGNRGPDVLSILLTK